MTQLIYVAAKLGIADRLADGPKRPDELARVLEVHPQALARLLRALSHYEVFEAYPDGRFALTGLGGLLRSDIPGSLRGFALLNGEPWVWRPWGELLYSVSTGQPAFEHLYEMGLFDYVHQHADVGALLDEAMLSANEHLPRAIVMAYDFADITAIVDVGGGYGELLAAILHAHPQICGVLLDLPETVEGARSRLHAAGVTLHPGGWRLLSKGARGRRPVYLEVDSPRLGRQTCRAAPDQLPPCDAARHAALSH